MVNLFDVILLDLGLPDSQGLDTLRTLRGKNPQVAVVVLTGKDDEELALQALKEGAQDYLVKGEIQGGTLQRAIRYAVERSGSEKLLRRSEERVRELTAHIHQVLWMMDAKESKIIYISPGYEKMWGRSCQSLLDNPHAYMEGVHPLDQEMMRREDAAMYQTGHIDVECRVLRPDGSVRWVWIRGYPVKEQGQIVRIVGVIEDITDKRGLAAERDALLSRLQLHIERMPLAYVLLDAAMHIIDWNSTAERIFGYAKEEMLGTGPPYEKFVPRSFWEKAEEIRSRIRSGDMQAHSVNENLTKDGRTITCEWFNTPLLEMDNTWVGFLCLAQDVTGQKVLEEQFRQAQKMEAIGCLAGGVAHDFNNMLTVINGFSDMIQIQLPTDSPLLELVREITRAGERAASLTRQLLAFSRRQVLEPKVLSLNTIIADTTKMLERLIGEDIDLKAVLEPELGWLKADPGQIEQVIMNLAVNARDAMPQGGKLTIETANTELDETYTRAYPELRPGPYVLLAVADTGTGMDAATKARIFEPFFTTKEPGKGTGLGLATVFGIVKQSEGHIAVFSELGLGTTFKIYLPRLKEKNGAVSAAPARSCKELAGMARGSETILVVEDDAGVLGFIRHILQTNGYTVLEAACGDVAIQLVTQQQGPIHLLITDVVMPGISGRLVAERIVRLKPDIRVLFLSGYTNDAMIRHGILESESAFLQKPFRPMALASKVREVLDGPGVK